MFLSARGGTMSAATMVFALETEVDADSALKVTDNLDTPMYETLTHEVLIDNPFQANGHFTVQIHAEYIRPTTGKPFPEEESIHQFPDAFWSPNDTLSLKKRPSEVHSSIHALRARKVSSPRRLPRREDR